MMNLSGKRIALIGGAGFVGHHLALKLKALGAEPHVIDGLQVNNLGAFTSNLHEDPNADLYVKFINDRLSLLREAEIRMHIVDARDYELLGSHLHAIRPDTVVHLAAIAHADKANKDPYNTFDHSLRTLENALDCVRTRKPHFIYFSSSTVYGDLHGEVAAEDDDCNPIGINGALKLAGEKLVVAYKQVFDLSYTVVRPSALYGERCVSRHIAQALIESALTGQSLMIDQRGTDSFDFTFIDDLVAGVVLCIGTESARNQVFNLSFGQARPIDDLVAILKDHFPTLSITKSMQKNRPFAASFLSIEKARKMLGYAPQFPLELGYVAYLKWYKEQAENSPALSSTLTVGTPMAGI